MSTSTSASPAGTADSRRSAPLGSRWRWRVVDIVVAAVLAVASAVVFWLWDTAYLGPSALLEPLLPGLQGLLNGPWLFAGVLGALVIRKPGAAIFVETVAAVVEALLGNQWGGLATIEIGLVQGLGAELIFLIFFYRRWNLGVALLAGAGAGIAGAINSLVAYYPGADAPFAVIYLVSSCISGAVVAGLGAWLIARGLAKTGALSRFAAGRDVTARV